MTNHNKKTRRVGMLDRFYFKATHHVGYGEANVQRGVFAGNCAACGLMLIVSDVVCPRCMNPLKQKGVA